MSNDTGFEITRFERARAIGERARQISLGAPSTIDFGEETDYLKIAVMEYDAGKCPLIIVRTMPDGTVVRVHLYKEEEKNENEE